MSVITARRQTGVRVTPFSVSDADRNRCEFIGGEYREKLKGTESEWIAGMLLVLLSNYCMTKKLGWVFGSNTSFQCFDEEFPEDPERFRKPDVAFVTKQRLPRLPQGHCPIAPDLAVEVISPHDSVSEVNEKVEEYFLVRLSVVLYSSEVEWP